MPNDTPQVNVPTDLEVELGSLLTFTPGAPETELSISDRFNDNLTVGVAWFNGQLIFTQVPRNANGFSLSQGFTADSVRIEGSVEQINAVLAGAAFQPDVIGTAGIVLTVDDQSPGIDGPQSA